MFFLAATNGFIKLYKCFFPNDNIVCEQKYQVVDNFYFGIFGSHRYNSYLNFLADVIPVQKTVVKTINADLKKWYVAKGFNTFSKLQPIVKNFYPEVSSKDILDFWNNKPIYADSLQCIGYVKQILE